MDTTQNDLSHNHTKLDYQALLKCATIAFAHTRNEVEKYIHNTHSLDSDIHYSSDARRLLEEAKQMVIAAETMDTLKGGLTREELEIVNKPEIKEG